MFAPKETPAPTNLQTAHPSPSFSLFLVLFFLFLQSSKNRNLFSLSAVAMYEQLLSTAKNLALAPLGIPSFVLSYWLSCPSSVPHCGFFRSKQQVKGQLILLAGEGFGTQLRFKWDVDRRCMGLPTEPARTQKTNNKK